MECYKWSKIINHWINCLGVPNLKVSGVNDLNVRVFYELINFFHNVDEAVVGDSKHHTDTVLSFLKREYPLFTPWKDLESVGEDENILIASLLLYYSCIKSNDGSIRGAMCQRLSSGDQKAITLFANSLMKHEKITEEKLINTICELPQSEISPMHWAGSPGGSSSPFTPKGRRSRRLLSLQAALDSERFDRNFLQEELARQSAKYTDLEKQNCLYHSEIVSLKSELLACATPSERGDSRGAENEETTKLRAELKKTYEELLNTEKDLDNATEERDNHKKKIGDIERELSAYRNRIIDLENTKEQMSVQISEDASQISILKKELAEFNKFLELQRREHHLNESIECDDDTLSLKKGFGSSFNCTVENLGNAVIDVQLREQINQNNLLTNRLEELLKEKNAMDNQLLILAQHLEDFKNECLILSASNTDLKNKRELQKTEISHKESIIQNYELDIQVLREALQRTESNNNDLNVESEKLKHCYEQQEKENNDLHIKVNELELLSEELKTLQSDFNSKVEILNTVTDEKLKLCHHIEEQKSELKALNEQVDLQKSDISNKVSIIQANQSEFLILHKALQEIESKNNDLTVTNGELIQYQELQERAKDEIQMSLECLKLEHHKIKNDLQTKVIELGILSEKFQTLQGDFISKDEILNAVTNEKLKLEHEIEEKTSELTTLNKQVDLQKSEIADKVSFIQNYDLEFKSLGEELRATDLKYNDIVAVNEELKCCRDKQEIERINLNTKVDELEHHIKEQVSELKALNEQVDCQKSDISSKVSLIQNNESEVQILREVLRETESKNNDLIAANEELQQCQEQNEKAKDEIQMSLECLKIEHKKIEHNLHSRVNKLEHHTMEQESELKALNEQVDLQKSLISEKESLIKKTKSELKALREVLQNTESKNNDLIAANEELKHCQEQQEKVRDEIHISFECLKVEHREIENDLQTKVIELEMLSEEFQNLQVDFISKDEILNSVTDEKLNLEHHIKKQESELNALNEKLNLQKFDISNKLLIIEASESEFQTLRRELQEAESKNNDLIVENNELICSQEHKQKARDEILTSFECLQVDYKKIQDDLHTKVHELALLSKDFETLQCDKNETLIAVAGEKLELEHHIKDQLSELETLNKQVEFQKSNISKKESLILKTESELKTLREILQKTESKNNDLIAANEELKLCLEQKEKAKDEMQMSLERLKVEHEKIERNLHSRVNKLEHHTKEQESELKVLNQQVDLQKSLISEKESLIQKTESELKTLQVVLQNTESKNNDLIAANEELKLCQEQREKQKDEIQISLECLKVDHEKIEHNLHSRVNKLEHHTMEQESELKALNEQVDLQKSLLSEKESLIQKTESELKTLHEILQTTESKNGDLVMTNKELIYSQEQTEKARYEIQISLECLQVEHKRVEDDLLNKVNELGLLRKEMDILHGDSISKEELLNQLKSENIKLEDDIKEQISELKSRSEQVDLHKSEIFIKLSLIENCESELQALREVLREANSKNNDLIAANEELKCCQKRQENAKNELLKCFECLKVEHKKVENDLRMKVLELKSLNKEVETLQCDHISKEVLNSLINEKLKLEHHTNGQLSEIIILKERVENQISDIFNKESLIQNYVLELENIHEKVDTLESQIEKMESAKNDILSEHQANIRELNNNLAKKSSNIEHLQILNTKLEIQIEMLNLELTDSKQYFSELTESKSLIIELSETLDRLKQEESKLKVDLSSLNDMYEKCNTQLSLQNDELVTKNMEAVYHEQEINNLNVIVADKNVEFKNYAEKLESLSKENSILLKEKNELEDFIDGVHLELLDDNHLQDCNNTQPEIFEFNSLDFESVLVKSEATTKTEDVNIVTEHTKVNNIKMKLISLCNSTEMISKTCAKTILEKDETIIKLTEECDFLREHIDQLETDTGIMQQKLLNIEDLNIANQTNNENQHRNLTDLSIKITKINEELQETKCELYLSKQNEQTLQKMLYSKVQQLSDYLRTNTKNHVLFEKLKAFENTLSKIWEVVCEAVKRLKNISLPIEGDLFPLTVQVPFMESLKTIDSAHFESSKNIFNMLATVSNSIDYVENYVDNLCKMIVSLVKDRITCRDTLARLEKQRSAVSDECLQYKNKYQSATNEKEIVTKKLTELESAKTLNNSDTITSTTVHSINKMHSPHFEEFLKMLNVNGSRLMYIFSLQVTRTNNVNKLKDSLHKLNENFYNCMGDKIALKNTINTYKNIEKKISELEVENAQLIDKIGKFSTDLYSFFVKKFQKDFDNSNSSESQDLWFINFENELEAIETITLSVQNNIPLIHESIETLKSSTTKNKIDMPIYFDADNRKLSIYEQLQDLVEKYTLIKEYENTNTSAIKSLKQLQEHNLEMSNERSELENKVFALRKVLKEIESKNKDLIVANEESKRFQEQNEFLMKSEKDFNRKTMAENTSLKKQVTSLSYKVDEIHSQYKVELEELKREIEKLSRESLKTKSKLENGADTNQLVTDMRNEYEDKLTRMKQKMKQLYQEQISVYTEKQKEETASLEALCKKYSEKINRYEVHVNHLMFEQWKVGEKLLNEKKENDELRKKLGERLGSQQSINSITSTTSLPHTKMEMRRNTIDTRLPQKRFYPSPVKEQPSLFKQPAASKVESGGLHMSDEEGEVFDNTYLTELRSGVYEPRASSTAHSLNVHTAQPRDNRLSELQWRNSLCLPHLKSSYPAETQFRRFKEEDIKTGTINLDESPAVEKPRAKKEAGQTSYHKPGPPTPSKNGGRSSLQGNDLREPLKEQNDNAKKATTPSRIKSLFMGNTSKSSSRDENTFGTPKGRRLSIFRKQR